MPRNPHVGVGFPFRFEGGRTRTVGGQADRVPTDGEVRAAWTEGLWVLLSWPAGTRVMNPNFGIGLIAYLFNPIHSRQPGLLRREVQEQIELWNARVVVEAVSVETDAARGRIRIAPKVRAVGLSYGGVTPIIV